MVLLAFSAVKINANKNWQSQHLITLEVFVSETLCKRIALVSLQTLLAKINYNSLLYFYLIYSRLNNKTLVQTNNADVSFFVSQQPSRRCLSALHCNHFLQKT